MLLHCCYSRTAVAQRLSALALKQQQRQEVTARTTMVLCTALLKGAFLQLPPVEPPYGFSCLSVGIQAGLSVTIMDAASGQLLSPPPRSTEPDVKLLDAWLRVLGCSSDTVYSATSNPPNLHGTGQPSYM